MRIGYCTLGDPRDKRTFSGTHYHIMTALKNNNYNIVPFGPINTKWTFIGQIIGKIFKKFFNKSFPYYQTMFISKRLGKILDKKISKEKVSILFFVVGSEILAFHNKKIPVIYLSDSTFNLMIDYYPERTNIPAFIKKSGHEIERNAINKADKIIYAASWAAESAINYYKCTKDKIAIIPFGANIEEVPEKSEILNNIKNKIKSNIIRLLFIGKDWYRKGGPIAFETMEELNRRGVRTELIVVGCNPPKQYKHDNLILKGFINKNNVEGALLFNQLFKDSSFLMFPTRGECTGIVNCEASAFGLPIISTKTGGVPTYVEDNITGFLLDLDAKKEDYADIITEAWKNVDRYQKLCINARVKYDRELNWNNWGFQVSKLINQFSG
jgi:glycosyltransferase involved in cell wall biosynthesis